LPSVDMQRVIGDFLLQQTCLEHLSVDYIGKWSEALWNDFGFKLKTLKVSHNFEIDLYTASANEFFTTQNELESLDLYVDHTAYFSFNRLQLILKAIFALPKLQNLTMETRGLFYLSPLPGARFFAGLSNNTIRKLHLKTPGRNLIRIANSMHAIERIYMDCKELSLSKLRLDVIEKIIFTGQEVHYRPVLAPNDRHKFERAFTSFIKNCSSDIKEMHIGHPNWLQQWRFFQVSLDVCKLQARAHDAPGTSHRNATRPMKDVRLYIFRFILLGKDELLLLWGWNTITQ